MKKKTLFIILTIVLLAVVIYLFMINQESCKGEIAEDGSCVIAPDYWDGVDTSEREDRCFTLKDGRRACYLGKANISSGNVSNNEFELL